MRALLLMALHSFASNVMNEIVENGKFAWEMKGMRCLESDGDNMARTYTYWMFACIALNVQ